MLINWKAEGPLSIGHPWTEAQKKKAGPGIPVVTNFTICVPGINHLDDKIWEKVKGDTTIAKYIEDDKLAIVTEKDASDADAKKKGYARELADMEGPDAVKIITKTLSKPLLESWQNVDSRPLIQAACMRQLDKLKIKVKGE